MRNMDGYSNWGNWILAVSQNNNILLKFKYDIYKTS